MDALDRMEKDYESVRTHIENRRALATRQVLSESIRHDVLAIINKKHSEYEPEITSASPILQEYIKWLEYLHASVWCNRCENIKNVDASINDTTQDISYSYINKELKPIAPVANETTQLAKEVDALQLKLKEMETVVISYEKSIISYGEQIEEFKKKIKSFSTAPATAIPVTPPTTPSVSSPSQRLTPIQIMDDYQDYAMRALLEADDLLGDE